MPEEVKKKKKVKIIQPNPGNCDYIHCSVKDQSYKEKYPENTCISSWVKLTVIINPKHV